MHILIGVIVALAVLAGWLTGHWFARVLAFLLFGVVFGFIASVLLPHQAGAVANGEVGFPLGFFVAWFVSGIPTYVWRRKMDRLNGVSMERYQGGG